MHPELDIAAREQAEREHEEQTAFLNALVQTSPLAIVAVDPDHRVRMCNQAFEQLFLFSQNEIIGVPLDELIAPPGKASEANDLTRRAVSGEGVHVTTHRCRKDGTPVEVEVYGVPLKLRGELVGGFGLYIDVTERRRAEESLHEVKERFRTLFENMVIGLYRTTPDGRILLANPTLVRMLGYSSFEDLSQRNLEEMGYEPTYSRSEFKQLMEREGQVVGQESAWKKRDGTVLLVRESARAIRDAQGNVLYYEGTAEDITARKRAEEALRESESRNRAILNALPDLMFLQTTEGVYLDYHASDPNLLLLPPERFLGKAMGEVLPAELAVSFEKHFQRLRDTGEVQTLEYPLRLSGELRSFEARMVPCGRDRVLSLVRDITERKRSEAALRQRQREVDTLLDSLPAYAYFKKAGSIYLTANRRFCEAVGCAPEKMAGKTDYDFFPRDLAEKYRTDDARMVITGETLWVGEEEMVDRGRRFTVETRKVPVKDEKGTVVGLIGLAFDTSERKLLEEQLLQSQKMEAIGRLAGGVAHDFNNLLTAIMSYGDILQEGLAESDPLRRSAEGILATAERASSLTQQLLAFSRKQAFEPGVVSLNAVIADMDKMLRRLIREDIEVSVSLAPDLGSVKADPVQLEQVLINLVVNARDAMPEGGQLVLRTAEVDLEPTYVQRHPGAAPGPHILLSVSDTGCGMDAETQSHIFEPFFTTKGKGQGTGLGLSTVYGIVKQSGGHIEVQSMPGQGTKFTIYLPRAEEEAGRPAPTVIPKGATRGEETILLVEDEPEIRGLIRTLLRAHGYTVLDAGSGEVALAASKEHSGLIHLLVTDVIMPQMNGWELARQLASLRPAMKVLYISGHTDDEIVRRSVLEPGFPFLPKPIKPEALLRKIREVLDSP